MNPSGTTLAPGAVGSTEIRLPSTGLLHLRRALRAEVDSLAATHVLYNAGFGVGEALLQEFEAEADEPAALGEAAFWRELSEFFERRGWGRIEPERVHPGLGMIRAAEWAEADPDGSEAQPGCHFSCGFMAYLLGRAAAAPVAVLEVRCRGRGDPHCEFLYGSEAAVHEMYGLLLEGAPLHEALAAL